MARPDSDSWFSEGRNDPDKLIVDYRHTDYDHTGFRTEYEYYSLGLILLEIGLWRPLRSITSKWPTASPTEIHRRLIEDWVPQLRSKMGVAFEEMVRTCLETSWTKDRNLGNDTQAVRSAFFGEGVQKFEGNCRVTIVVKS